MKWDALCELEPRAGVFDALCQSLVLENKTLDDLIQVVDAWPETTPRRFPRARLPELFEAETCELLLACNTLVIEGHAFTDDEMTRLLAQPGLEFVTALELRSCTLKATQVALLAQASELVSVKSLEFHHTKTTQVLLHTFTWLDGIERLVVVESPKVWAGSLLDSPKVSNLTHLEASSGKRYTSKVARSTKLENLESLYLGVDYVDYDAEISEVALSANLPSLHTLRTNRLEPTDAFVFRNGLPALRNIGDLCLAFDKDMILYEGYDFRLGRLDSLPFAEFSEQDVAGLQAVVDEKSWTTLSPKQFERYTRQRPTSALEGDSILRRLDEVAFGQGKDRDTHREVLIAALRTGALSKVRTLRLADAVTLGGRKKKPAELGDAFLTADFERLSSLTVSIDFASTKWVESLRDAPCMQNLKELRLTATSSAKKIDYSALLTNTLVSDLEVLELHGVPFTPAMLEALASSGRLEHLTSLAIDLDDAGLVTLLAASSLPRLTSLTLAGSSLTPKAGATLGAHPLLSRLHELRVRGHALAEEGARAILESPLFVGLELLDIHDNGIHNDYRFSLREDPPLVHVLEMKKPKKPRAPKPSRAAAPTHAVAPPTAAPFDANVLTALLEREPSSHVFELITRALGTHPEATEHLQSVLDAVSQWPDAIERRTPAIWIEPLLQDGSDTPLLGLCNTLHLERAKFKKAAHIDRLFGSTSLRDLHTLRFVRCSFSGKLATRLAEHPWKQTARHLQLEHITLKPEHVRALAQADVFANLTTLELVHTLKTREHVDALLDTPTPIAWEELILDVGENTAFARLCEGPTVFEKLERLAILKAWEHSEDLASAYALSQSDAFPALRRLEWPKARRVPRALWLSELFAGLESLPPVRVPMHNKDGIDSKNPEESLFVSLTPKRLESAKRAASKRITSEVGESDVASYLGIPESEYLANFTIEEWLDSASMKNRRSLEIHDTNSWTREAGRLFALHDGVGRALESLRIGGGAPYQIHNVFISECFANVRSLDMALGGSVYTSYRGGSPLLMGLSELTLRRIYSVDDVLEVLLSSPDLEGLKSLRFTYCHLTVKVARLLRTIGVLNRVESFSMTDCGVGDGILDTFLEVDAFTNGTLRHLDLSENSISAKGAQIIASHPGFRNVETLVLTKNKINDAGLDYLLESETLTKLRTLDVRGNKLSKPNLAALSATIPSTVDELVF